MSWLGLLCLAAEACAGGSEDLLFNPDCGRGEPGEPVYSGEFLGGSLESHGVTPFGSLTTEIWGNVTGGVQRGAWWDQLLDVGLELDLATLRGWEGGRFVAQAHWAANSRRDPTFADYAGIVSPVSGIMAADHLRVFNLYYQQSWSGGAAVLKLGQLAADDDFMLSRYNGLFANSVFGAMPSQAGNRLGSCCGFSLPFPMYPVAAPGVFLRVSPTESLRFQGAIYDGRPGEDTPGNLGFDWAIQSHWEAAVFFEAGHDFELGERNGSVRLGISYNSGDLEDFSVADGGVSGRRRAVPSYYAVYDQELLRSSEGETRAGVFCRAGASSDPDRSTVGAYIDGGVNWFGPIAGRPDDLAGIAAGHTRFGQAFRESTGPGGTPADQTAVEVAYRAQATQRLTLQGDVQVLFKPVGSPERRARGTAVVLGVRARLTF